MAETVTADVKHSPLLLPIRARGRIPAFFHSWLIELNPPARWRRGWTLVWGALSLLMTLIPTFRDFRLLNVVAMAGTAFTALYIWAASIGHGLTPAAAHLAPYSFQSFFTGANVFLWVRALPTYVVFSLPPRTWRPTPSSPSSPAPASSSGCVRCSLFLIPRAAAHLAPYSFQSFFTGANVFLWVRALPTYVVFSLPPRTWRPTPSSPSSPAPASSSG